MKMTKLETLLEDDQFDDSYIDFESGVLITNHNDSVVYMILEYEEYFHVYLQFEDEEEPFHDCIIEGIAVTREQAQQIAIQNLNEFIYQNIN